MNELPVISAIREFDSAQARWLLVAPPDGALHATASVEQRTAFERMRAADRAYVWARDIAIHRIRLDFSYEEPRLRWPVEPRVSLAKSQRRPGAHQLHVVIDGACS
jgi:hypothetical protein